MTEAQKELVLNNQGLIIHIWDKHIYKGGIVKRWKDDIIQEGYFALCRAAMYFDSTRGYEFSSFACKCIRTRMLHVINWLYNKVLLDIGGESLIFDFEDPLNTPKSILDYISYELNTDDIEDTADAERLLKRLTKKERWVIGKWIEGEQTSAQIAAEIGSTAGSIREQVRKIRKKLKKWYEEG